MPTTQQDLYHAGRTNGFHFERSLLYVLLITRNGFLNLNFWYFGWEIICPAYRRIFSSTPGLCPLDASSHLPTLYPAVTTKKVPRHCQVSPEGQNHLHLRTTGVELPRLGGSELHSTQNHFSGDSVIGCFLSNASLMSSFFMALLEKFCCLWILVISYYCKH